MAKTHVIDGKKYVAVDRKAEMGEKILVDRNEMHHDLIIGSIYEMGRDGNINSWYVENEDGSKRDYVVLEPLASEAVTVDTSQASEQVIEMFTALSRKIVSIESQLADTQNNVEKLSKEIAEANYVLNSPSPWATQEDIIELNGQVRRILADIVELDERTNSFDTSSKSGANLLAEAFDALARYERTVGR